MDYAKLLERSANLNPQKTALVCGNLRLSYQELLVRVTQLACAFESLGVKPGEMVAILCENRNEYVEFIFACSKINAVAVNLNWRWSEKEILKAVEKHKIKYMLISKKFCLLCDELSYLGVKFISIGNRLRGAACEYEQFLEGSADCVPSPVAKNAKDIAMEFFTSGTTDRPKGVLLSHASMVYHALANIIDEE